MSNRGLLATMVGALLVTVGPVEIRAQTRASSRPVSPTVFASYISRGEHLTLLVLWRGSPGWFWSVEGGSGGAGGSGDRMFQVVNAGGLTFRIEYDFQAGTATVEGRTVTLNDTNVVLVDNVATVLTMSPIARNTVALDRLVVGCDRLGGTWSWSDRPERKRRISADRHS